MKTRFAVSTALAAALVLVSSSRDAHALGPIDIEVAAKAGAGTTPSNESVNPFGFGIGARGGVSILGIYGGVNVVNYFGSSNDFVSVHALLYGLEAGFGIKLLALTIRPQLGVGNATYSASSNASVGGVTFSGSQSNSYLYLEPGVTGLLAFDSWIVGADVNYLVVPGIDRAGGGSSADTSLTIHGQVGLRF